jgi:hypothetical protein
VQIDPLAGPKSKLVWATKRIRELYDLQSAFFRDNTYALVGCVDPRTRHRLVILRAVEPMPDGVYHLTAEIVYHLRSALDQTVCALAIANGQSPNTQTAFPFADSQQEFEEKKTLNRLKLLTPYAADLIRGFGSYKGGNDALWAFNKLSNIDRHNDLIPSGAVAQTTGVRSLRTRSSGGGGVRMFPSGRIDTGILIADLGFEGEFSTDCPLEEPNFAIDEGEISFGRDVVLFAGQPVLMTLSTVRAQVENIVRIVDSQYFGAAKNSP